MRGESDQAEECYRKGMEMAPEIPEVHYNLGILHLARERFEEGWPEYLWRFKCRDVPDRDIPGPIWQGEESPGKTLLIYAEQGLGDMFQMLRYVELARRRVGRVLLEVHAPLVPLMRSSGYSDVIAAGTPLPAFDLRCPILNLPSAFATNLENMPRDVPYLHADPALVEQWQRQAGAVCGFQGRHCLAGQPRLCLRSRTLDSAAALRAAGHRGRTAC